MLYKKLLNKHEALSEISRDIGLVFFATMFVEPITGNAYNVVHIATGLSVALASWTFSLSIARK